MSLQALRPATEAYLELSRTSRMEFFVKIGYGFGNSRKSMNSYFSLKATEKLQVLSETICVYCNAVSVSSCALFRQYLFLCRPDSIAIFIKS